MGRVAGSIKDIKPAKEMSVFSTFQRKYRLTASQSRRACEHSSQKLEYCNITTNLEGETVNETIAFVYLLAFMNQGR